MAANPHAFPSEPGDSRWDNTFRGMTLRDWFAGQAVEPVARTVIDAGMGPAPEADAELIALIVYKIADAMLAERSKARQS